MISLECEEKKQEFVKNVLSCLPINLIFVENPYALHRPRVFRKNLSLLHTKLGKKHMGPQRLNPTTLHLYFLQKYWYNIESGVLQEYVYAG